MRMVLPSEFWGDRRFASVPPPSVGGRAGCIDLSRETSERRDLALSSRPADRRIRSTAARMLSQLSGLTVAADGHNRG